MINPVNTTCNVFESIADVIIDLGQGYVSDRQATASHRQRAMREEYLNEGDSLIQKRIERLEKAQAAYKASHNGSENKKITDQLDKLYDLLGSGS